MVLAIVKDIVESVAGDSKTWKAGTRVVHPTDGVVEIVGGAFWGTHGVSNFWYWCKVNADDTLSTIKHHGYGWL